MLYTWILGVNPRCDLEMKWKRKKKLSEFGDIMVLKTGPDRPVEPSIGELSGSVRSMNHFLPNQHWNVQINSWTVEPDDPSDFLQTGHILDNKFLFTM